MSRMLSHAGFEVHVASEGAEGLAKIKAAKPDVVVCDLSMPGVNGFGLLELLRNDAATAHLPFVVVTSAEDRESVRRGLRLGADDYLSKPLDREELIAAVMQALDKHRRLTQLVAETAFSPQEQLLDIYRSRSGRDDQPHVSGPAGARVSETTGRLVQQTVLFSGALDQTRQAIGDGLENGIADRPSELVVRGYRVLAKIGEGGMSTAYLAVQESHQRKAVLKVVKVRREDDESLWRRFFQECAILSGIDHKHVVRIYDQGFGDEMAYIAMEYLAGGTLREVIDKGVSRRQALSLLSQAASGLAEIHQHGIVHRDIKPANLMLRSEGVLVLTDFGVAKRLNHIGNTVYGEILGTPYYLSPEQAHGGHISPATDLYSLGVIFYEMLTGSRPYEGETISEIVAQHLTAPVPRLPAELSEFQRLIDSMLAKRPEERFPDSAAVLSEIDRVWTIQALHNSSLM